MEISTKPTKQTFSHHGLRFICFVVLSSIGMSTIAIALLVAPLTRFHNDNVALQTQRNRVNALKTLLSQQSELIANANNPSVVERAAINNLNYVPATIARDQNHIKLIHWPMLDHAVKKIADKPTHAKPQYLILACELAEQPTKQSILLILGSTLVVISMTFFNQKPRE